MLHKKKVLKVVDVGGVKRLLRMEIDIGYGDGCFTASGWLTCDWYEVGGQCLNEMKRFLDANGLKAILLDKVLKVWPRYHNNNLIPGSPRQMEIFHERKAAGLPCYYDTMCRVLKDIGLYEDKDFIYKGKPYAYGTAWLKEELPDDAKAAIEDAIATPLEVVAA